MIDFKQAYEIVQTNLRHITEIEEVELTDCVGRVLAKNIAADRPAPPFNRVAMDGYACRKEDIGKELMILEVVPAGKKPEKVIGPGQCSKVMTGCPLPEGAEMVFMIEISEEKEGGKVVCTDPEKAAKAENFAKTGEDARRGTILIYHGTLLETKHVQTLAAVGVPKVPVFRKPVIGIIATGDELVEPNENPLPHQIRNSNGYSLYAQMEKIGAQVKYYGIVKDDAEKTFELLQQADEECDAVLMSGGVSEGDFDFVPDAMRKVGYKILFDKVKIKPGKPTTFAVSENSVCFGMPGNPVSTFVIAEIVVKPYLMAAMSANYNPKTVKTVISSGFKRRKTVRTEYVPVKFNPDGTASVLRYHGSGHLTSLVETDGFIAVQAGVAEVEKGALELVLLI